MHQHQYNNKLKVKKVESVSEFPLLYLPSSLHYKSNRLKLGVMTLDRVPTPELNFFFQSSNFIQNYIDK